jgi:hypothetical protein
MVLDCGACNLCCKLLGVPDINKPARMLCWWTGIHGGCERHHEKQTDPQLMACAQFKCLWLESQTHPDPTKHMPRHLRPDLSHVVIGPVDRDDDTLAYVQVDPEFPQSLHNPEIKNYLDGIISRGGKLEIILGDDIRIEYKVEGGSKIRVGISNV